jgi:uncharacterized protein YjbI with pentapeptide repeats
MPETPKVRGGSTSPRTDLTHADLIAANLNLADLTGADFTDANLTDALVHRDAVIPKGWQRHIISGRLKRADISSINTTPD